MQIGGVLPGGVNPEQALLPATLKETVAVSAILSLPTAPVGDSVGTLLLQMAAAPIAQLISEIATSHPVADPIVTNSLLHAAVAAAQEGNVPAALAAITELVHRSPELAETLPTEPSLSPIRAQVQDLLTHVISAAKVEAEVRLSTATQAVESARPHSMRPGDLNPKEILPIAEQLIDSGRHANVLLATDLSQAVINYYGGFDIAAPRPITQRARISSPRPDYSAFPSALEQCGGSNPRGRYRIPKDILATQSLAAVVPFLGSHERDGRCCRLDRPMEC